MSSGVVRPRPSDFWSVYVDVGKPGCEAHYRAHWKTVDRWVEEVGKNKLRAARAEKVAERRAKRNAAKVEAPKPLTDPCPPDPDDLMAAVRYLQSNANGGWRVGIAEDGRYFVGRNIVFGSEVVERALAKGMDEWYVERDMMNRLSLEAGTDEFVLDRELNA